jgi:amino-acid N-acetyltransferase
VNSEGNGFPLTLQAAAPDDLPAVQALLARNALPFEDIAPHFGHFLVAREAAVLRGVAGIEVHGAAGLLRSVCVDAAARGRGLGHRLCDALEARAIASGLDDLYLLTTTARAFFERRGYTAIDRAAAPERIRETAEFRSLCPSSAACLHKRLARASP